MWTLLWSLLKLATFQVLELGKGEKKRCSGTCPEDRLCFSHSSVFIWKASMYSLVQILCGKTPFFLPFYFFKKKTTVIVIKCFVFFSIWSNNCLLLSLWWRKMEIFSAHLSLFWFFSFAWISLEGGKEGGTLEEHCICNSAFILS